MPAPRWWAGVTPGREGAAVDGLPDVPVFNTMADAVDATSASVACIFVPPPFAADAILEDIAAGLELIVCITEGIPTIDMLRVMPMLRASSSRLIGPNCRESRFPARTSRWASCRGRFTRRDAWASSAAAAR